MATREKQSRPHDRNEVPQGAYELPDSFTLELTLQEMGFLRLLLTNATVQPAELKKLCGEVQAKIEAHIGPLPPA
jgi:hypothetical protein